MPGFDGTGPMGGGSMTGGGRGYCNPYGGPYGGRGFGAGRGFRRGFGTGYGRGRGYGYGRGFEWRGAYPARGATYEGPHYGARHQMNPDQEANMLNEEAQAMKNELDAINKRIEELDSKSSKE